VFGVKENLLGRTRWVRSGAIWRAENPQQYGGAQIAGNARSGVSCKTKKQDPQVLPS
jgi:hypothetical protein